MTDIEVLLQQVANVLDMRNKVSKVSGDDFNIFSVLDMETDEVKTHTRLIYELLRPDGQHGMGKAFIEEFFNYFSNCSAKATKAGTLKMQSRLETDTVKLA